MIPHPRNYTEQLLPADVDAILETALRILDRVGLLIESEEARRELAGAGGRIEAGADRVYLAPELVRKLISAAPPRWTLHARNPRRNVEIGGRRLLVSPGYGSPFVADARGVRRPAVMEDFHRFARLAGGAETVDITGGLLVEPGDVPPALRPLLLTQALVTQSDKPFFGSVAGAEGARESIQIARIVLGEIESRPSVLGLININSPLRLDSRMAEALLTYVKAGQPVLLTPGILLGITAPVTPAGALAQASAEVMAGVALTQAVRPGAPVIVGLGGFGADLRHGAPGFGRPENALATLLGAQIARKLGLPFRCSAAVTGARLPDARSGYERMLTALCGWQAGAHLALQAAGTLDCIQSMCFEQFLIDLEIWGYLRRLSAPPVVDEERLALDVIASRPPDYLSCEHTRAHFREELHFPALVPPESYSQWLDGGMKDVVRCAGDQGERLLAAYEPPPLEDSLCRELDGYVASRRAAIG